MPQSQVVVDVSAESAGSAQAIALASGGVFIAGQQMELLSECQIELRFANAKLLLLARVVHASPLGVAVEFIDCGPTVRDKISALLQTLADGVPGSDHVEKNALDTSIASAACDAADATDRIDTTMPRAPAHERLRNLPVIAQIKLALKADTADRILLERMYGKGVWEPLLRNPRITPPEVARIAKMGSLPRPLLEVIVGNGAWLGVPEVRRALLNNPRLSIDVVPRILRLMPKHELKLVPSQTGYASGIREHARRMLKEG